MEVLDARWETDQERSSRIKSYTNVNKRERSDRWCIENSDFIIESYKEFYIQYPLFLKSEQEIKNKAEYDKAIRHTQIFNAIKQGDTSHKCLCGGVLKYIDWHEGGFIGCTNYKQPVTHTKVYYHPYPACLLTTEPREIGKKHLNEFRLEYDIPDYVMTSSIFMILQTFEVPLLCHLNFYDFQNGVNSSRESKRQEQMLLFKLKPKFQIVHYQKGIKFTKDGSKWSVAIPDYICYNKHEPLIKVYDCKKAVRNIDDVQLDKYTSLIDFLLKKKGSADWKVEGHFLIFDPEEYSDDQLLKYNCISTKSLCNT